MNLISKSFLAVLIAITGTLHAQNYPSGFSQVEVASGISNPTVMAFAPDGRIFVAQQNGVLIVIKNATKLTTPAISLSVNSSGERGLIGIALHPSFSSNGIIYLHYTIPGGSRNRVSRFTLNGDVINPSSEQIIIELDQLSTATNHNGGAMHFLGDKLFIAVGDNANGANAQNLNTFHGKLLRINANGSIPGDNPFYSPYNTKQKNCVWAYGLRNPYTFDIQTSSGKVFVNDVGQNTWEEVNDATVKGKNFGWPATEGATTNPAYASPLYAYGHGSGDGVGCAITGGVFFNPSATNYPSSFTGKYFYQDLCNAWINYLDLSSGVTRHAFATSLPGQSLGLDIGTDGNLYFLSRTDSKLYKIVYNNTQPPVITDQPDDVSAASGELVTLSVSATGALPLSYQWYKNGSPISGATSSNYYITSLNTAGTGDYVVRVNNAYGTVTSDTATVSLSNNTLPVPTIISPGPNTLYRAGDVINFSGTATDNEDGRIPPSGMTWRVEFHHGTHFHDGPPVADGVAIGSFTIPASGETATNVFYRLLLTVTDSHGLSSTTFVDLYPLTSYITLKSNPPGLKLNLDYQPYTTPKTLKFVEGMTIALSGNWWEDQLLNGVSYRFEGWAHGGALQQGVLVPADNVTYTGNFSYPLNSSWRTMDIGKMNVLGSASENAGTYTLSASGKDIWNYDDHFRFVYKSLSGSGEITARVTSLSNTHEWAKAGVMIREGLQPGSKHAAMIVTPSSGTSFQRRVSSEGSSTATTSTGAVPIWVRIRRSGDVFSAFKSSDGSNWTPVGSSVTIPMNSTVLIGLALTSHNSNTLGTATFTNVAVTGSVSTSGFPLAEEFSSAETAAQIGVYPNPVKEGKLRVTVHEATEGLHEIYIINSIGQRVFRQQYVPVQDRALEIDVSAYPEGVYILKLQGQRKVYKAVFIKE
jgi:glucose/arabinose dehydrogenase/regulation of enolase protein 1 (concanavalin A-like superfamily)